MKLNTVVLFNEWGTIGGIKSNSFVIHKHIEIIIFNQYYCTIMPTGHDFYVRCRLIGSCNDRRFILCVVLLDILEQETVKRYC